MKKSLIVGALSLVVLVATALSFNEGQAVVQPAMQKDSVPAQYLATSSLPIPVVGTVAAASKATISAQVAGVVTSLPSKEGSLVARGVPLSVQATPVASAQVALTQTQTNLISVQQGAARAMSDSQVKIASARAYSANDIALLRGMQNDVRIKESAEILLDTTQATAAVTLAAMNYINNNRSLFSADGLRLFEQVLREGYGVSPSYFNRGVMYGERNNFSLREQLEAIQKNELTSIVDIENAAALTLSILETLKQVVATAERQVFKRGEESAETTQSYLAQKTNVSNAIQSVRSVQQSVRQVIDATLEDTAVQDVTAAVSALDEAAAKKQREFTAEISKWSEKVAQSQAGVAIAEQSLGTIRAPFSGVVSRVLVEEGEYVLPGTPLLEIIGDGAREVTVTVPNSLGATVAVGQLFVVDGVVAGLVDRLSPAATGRGMVVVITLSQSDASLGETVRGAIVTTPTEVVYSVPRSYVHFNSDGAFIRFQSGKESPVQILHDAVAVLYLTVTTASDEPLVPVFGISL